jgi:dipeptidyl-peptidase-3
VYKATAQVDKIKAFYDQYTAVDDRFEKLREIVMQRKPNRIQYVQLNTFVEDEKIVLRQYPAIKEGLIQS